MPYPRHRGTPRFMALRQQVLEAPDCNRADDTCAVAREQLVARARSSVVSVQHDARSHPALVTGAAPSCAWSREGNHLFDDANKCHRIGFFTAYGSRDPQAK